MIQKIKQSVLLFDFLIAVSVTAIFAIRWSTCLPFSGYMPVITDGDNVDLFGRFLVFAREPFGFPVGRIHGLSFPFNDANILRGSMPLFAILFKALGKIYTPFAQHYYFIFAELVAVFVSSLLVLRIFDLYHIKNRLYRLAGCLILVLSFALLHRSSKFYTISFVVLNFPVLFGLFYSYLLLHGGKIRAGVLGIAVTFPIAALLDYYLLFSLLILAGTAIAFDFIRAIVLKDSILKKAAVVEMFSSGAGAVAAKLCLRMIGNDANLEAPERSLVFRGRFADGWAYGGGFGGGFHVADLLTFFIPPNNGSTVHQSMQNGPSAIPTLLGWPLTTASLQRGQYEGFAYLGTAAWILVIALVVVFAIRRKELKSAFGEWRAAEFGLLAATLALFSVSLGYVVHIAGFRFPYIPTPATAIAYVWPTFMFARSLGRLDIALLVFVTLMILVGAHRWLFLPAEKKWRFLAPGAVILLGAIHIFEIRGYLDPPAVVAGNDLIDVFSQSDRVLIRDATRDRKALLVAPLIRNEFDWDRTCYSLAFHSLAPLSGSTVGFGEQELHLQWFRFDAQEIMNGHIAELRKRYGSIVIGVSRKNADEVLKKTNWPLKAVRLQSQDAVLLMTDESK